MDELVRSLRICGMWRNEVRVPGKSECDGCKYYDPETDACISWDFENKRENIILEAADVIEKLASGVPFPGLREESAVLKAMDAPFAVNISPDGSLWMWDSKKHYWVKQVDKMEVRE